MSPEKPVSDISTFAESYIDQCGEYVHASERDRLIADWNKKGQVAKSLIGDVAKRALDPRGKRVLDLGFGNGEFVRAFALAGADVTGIEVNDVLLNIAQSRLREEGITANLQVYDGVTFPFPDASFDLVFSTSVLEHVDDAAAVLQEVARVLKPDGRLYLAFPNRLAPKETHTGIWFLSYMPRSWANVIIRHIFRRDTIRELNLHFIGFFALRRYLRAAGLQILFEVDAPSRLRRLVKRFLASLGIHHSAILKTIMIVAKKEGEGGRV